MSVQPRLSAEQAAANMAETAPGYTPQQAVIEADRCLFCFDAPCIQACPTGIDVPSFIRKILTGNLAGSARTILEANVLGASCARVCPTEVLCEGACVVLNREGSPVKIGRLQRYATDHVHERGIQVLPPPARSSGKRVAVIGGGPSGLGCAAELARLGHHAIVFEKRPFAGGLNTYGVAYYKMKPEVSLDEVRMIEKLGVEFRRGTEVGRDVSAAELEQAFDAIFIGVGLGSGLPLGIPGGELAVDAIEFIEQIHTRPLHEIPVGRRVAVIGCGNTAIDAVTQARRLGAETATVIYRRGEPEMPAYPFEYELAKSDGAAFLFHATPVAILGNGTVTGLRLARTRVNSLGNIERIPGSEFEEPFDMVIQAVGQSRKDAWIQKTFPGLKIDKRGVILRDEATGRTNLPRVFAGGDCANGGREVVNAVAEGKKAARGIHAFLCGQPVAGPLQPSRHGVAGAPVGSGFDHPIRVHELKAATAGK